MAPGDLDFRLLLAILKRLGESRDEHDWVYTEYFVDLIAADQRSVQPQKNLLMLNRYLSFLEQKGYVSLPGPPRMFDMNRSVRMTSSGAVLVQPELAQIDDPNIFPHVIDSVERRVLSYPDTPQRAGFLLQLREAVAKNTPELVAKLLVEVLPKVLS